ncbi:hypothetical protein Tco_1354828 [Tanacetum coccineum]
MITYLTRKISRRFTTLYYTLPPNNTLSGLKQIKNDYDTNVMYDIARVAGKIQLFVSHHQIDLSTVLIPNDGSLEEAFADVMEVGHENVMTTQDYVRKISEDVSEDDHFTLGPWLSAIVHLHGEGLMASGCLGDMNKYCKNGKLELVIAVVMTCTPNSLGDMTVTLKDPTGIMAGTIHYKVFKKEDGYANSIKEGYVLILRNVSVFTPKPSKHYLNITVKNIVKVFDNDTVF